MKVRTKTTRGEVQAATSIQRIARGRKKREQIRLTKTSEVCSWLSAISQHGSPRAASASLHFPEELLFKPLVACNRQVTSILFIQIRFRRKVIRCDCKALHLLERLPTGCIGCRLLTAYPQQAAGGKVRHEDPGGRARPGDACRAGGRGPGRRRDPGRRARTGRPWQGRPDGGRPSTVRHQCAAGRAAGGGSGWSGEGRSAPSDHRCLLGMAIAMANRPGGRGAVRRRTRRHWRRCRRPSGRH